MKQLDLVQLKIAQKLLKLGRGLSTLLLTAVFLTVASTNAAGLGFFVTSDGYFVTNYETVINTGSYNVAIIDKFGNQFPAAIVATDVANDLALLKAKGSFAAIHIAQSSVIERGDKVLAIILRHGAKQGSGTGQGPSTGLVSAKVSSLYGLQGASNVFAITASSASSGFGGIGGTGGPLLTSEGSVVGVMVMPNRAKQVLVANKRDIENVAFAVKSDYLLALLSSKNIMLSQLQPLHVASARTHGQVAKYIAPAIGIVTSARDVNMKDSSYNNSLIPLIKPETIQHKANTATPVNSAIAVTQNSNNSDDKMFNTGYQALQQQDYPVAYHWLEQAAEQGHAKAQTALAGMYLNGQGVEKDALAASGWLRKAALQGDANAGENLGLLFRDGVGVEQDEIEAAWWFERSAKQGSPSAQANLGLMYEDGRGVSQDDAVAVQWFKRAAEQGNLLAQYRLGIHYIEGRGVAKDEAEAAKWLKQSAQLGFSQAQDYLRAGTAVP